jgi:hypothetical protein
VWIDSHGPGSALRLQSQFQRSIERFADIECLRDLFRLVVERFADIECLRDLFRLVVERFADIECLRDLFWGYVERFADIECLRGRQNKNPRKGGFCLTILLFKARSQGG